MLKHAICVGVVLVASGMACASIVNPGMESNTTAIFGHPDGWGPSGGWANHLGFARPNNGSLGENFAFYSVNNSETFGQVLTDVFAPNTAYTFASWGQGGGNNTGTMVYEIGYQDEMGGFVLLGQTAYVVGEAWEALDGVSFTTGASGDEIGRPVWVRMGASSPGGGAADDVWMDNFTFVPAPGAAALLGFGGSLMLRRKRN